jgi:antitoxin MazE
MKTRVQKWGNSLALRIPKVFAEDANLKQESAVDISFDEGKLVITPLGKKELNLKELLEQIMPENLHGEITTGPAVGKEVW